MNATRRFTLGKEERLSLKRRFDALVKEGRAFTCYPLRVRYRLSPRGEGEPPACMAVSVAKRRFKRSPDRNRVKRLAREVYRLRKHDLHALVPAGEVLDILLVYVGEEIADFVKMDKAMRHVIKKMRGATGVGEAGDRVDAPVAR
jgi:ribonuclease P protein component